MPTKSGFLAILCFWLLCACSSDTGDSGSPDGAHPSTSLIYQYDSDHIAIDATRPISEMDEMPSQIGGLRAYLSDPDSHSHRRIDTFTNGYSQLDAVEKNDNLLMLNHAEDQLLAYDASNNELKTIADEGHGPSELFATNDLDQLNDTIYVSRRDRQISVFSCENSDCDLASTLSMDGSVGSIAVVDENTIGVMRPARTTEPEGQWIKLLDHQGNALDSFGSIYLSSDPLANYHAARFGHLKYVSGKSLFLAYSSELPIIYIYDDNGNLVETYEISPFTFRTDEISDGRIKMIHAQDHTRLFIDSVVDDRFVVVQAHQRELSDEYEEGEPPSFNNKITYSIIDLSSSEVFYVGTDDPEEYKERQVTVTDLGLVVYEDGEILFVSN